MFTVLLLTLLELFFDHRAIEDEWFCNRCRSWNSLETAECSLCRAARSIHSPSPRGAGRGGPKAG